MTLRVLVVEDDTDFAEGLADALAFDGHVLEIAPSAEEALGRFAAGRYDVVLLDIQLPGMNGVECLRELRRADATVAVVMMTGYSERALIDEAREAGARDVLQKPFDVLGLSARLGSLPDG